MAATHQGTLNIHSILRGPSHKKFQTGLKPTPAWVQFVVWSDPSECSHMPPRVSIRLFKPVWNFSVLYTLVSSANPARESRKETELYYQHAVMEPTIHVEDVSFQLFLLELPIFVCSELYDVMCEIVVNFVELPCLDCGISRIYF